MSHSLIYVSMWWHGLCSVSALGKKDFLFIIPLHPTEVTALSSNYQLDHKQTRALLNELNQFNQPRIYEQIKTAGYMMVFGFSENTKHLSLNTVNLSHKHHTHRFTLALSLPHTYELYQPILSITWIAHTRLSIHPTYTNTLSLFPVSYTCTYSTAEHDYLMIGQRIAEHSRSLQRSTTSWCPVENKMTG